MGKAQKPIQPTKWLYLVIDPRGKQLVTINAASKVEASEEIRRQFPGKDARIIFHGSEY